MTALRIFATARPSLIGAPVQPITAREQWELDELARRREVKRREAADRASREAAA